MSILVYFLVIVWHLQFFFTKIFKPIVAQIRLNGLRIVIFLDDILLVASSFAECMEQLSLLRKLLESLGFVINDAKSQ